MSEEKWRMCASEIWDLFHIDGEIRKGLGLTPKGETV